MMLPVERNTQREHTIQPSTAAPPLRLVVHSVEHGGLAVRRGALAFSFQSPFLSGRAEDKAHDAAALPTAANHVKGAGRSLFRLCTAHVGRA